MLCGGFGFGCCLLVGCFSWLRVWVWFVYLGWVGCLFGMIGCLFGMIGCLMLFVLVVGLCLVLGVYAYNDYLYLFFL